MSLKAKMCMQFWKICNKIHKTYKSKLRMMEESLDHQFHGLKNILVKTASHYYNRENKEDCLAPHF